MKVRDILKRLAEDGWVLARYEGSHRQFKHPDKRATTTVNGKPSDEITGDLLRSIEKQCGLRLR